MKDKLTMVMILDGFGEKTNENMANNRYSCK